MNKILKSDKKFTRSFYNESGKKTSSFPHFYEVLINIFKAKKWRCRKDEFLNFEVKRSIKRNDNSNEIVYNVIGHSTVLIQLNGLNIITDPVLSNIVGPFGIIGSVRKTPPTISIEELPKIDLILLSHDHYDHLDKKTLSYLIKKYNPKIITGLNTGKHLNVFKRKYKTKIIELNWWDHYQTDDLKIYFVPAQHFSGRGLFFNKTLWGGFVIKSENFTIWFAGDTGYYDGLYTINEKLGPFDLAFLPIGHYEPNYYLKEKHMSPLDAAQLHKKMRIKSTIAIHFGTYRMSLDDYHDQIEDYYSAVENENLSIDDFSLPIFGKYEIVSK